MTTLFLFGCGSDGATPSDTSVEDAQDGDTVAGEDTTTADSAVADSTASDTLTGDTASQDTGGGGLPGESCANPVVIAGPGVLEAQSLAGYGADVQWGDGCGATFGVERVYSLSLDASKELVVTGTPTAQLDIELALVAGSDATACSGGVACLRTASWEGFGGAETLRYVNYEGPAVDLFLIVTGGNMSPGPGTFDLDVAITDAPQHPAGDLCAEPEPVVWTDGVASFEGESLEGHENEWEHGSGECSRLVGRDKFYALGIPAGERLIARIAVTGGTSGGEWALLSGASPCVPAEATCEAAEYLRGGDMPDFGEIPVVYENATTEPFDAILVVDQQADESYPGFEPLTYDLSLFVGPVPVGDRCADAPAIGDGQTLSGETTTGCVGDYWGARCPGLGTGVPDRVYTLTIPAGMQATLTATTAADMDLTLNLVEDTGASTCDEHLTCVARAFEATPQAPRTLSWSNRGDAAVDYLVIVSSTHGDGDFDLSLALSTAPARPAGDLCDTAVLLEIPAGGLTLEGQTTAGYGEDYEHGGCLSSHGLEGADRIYAADVPAGQRLFVTLTPDDADSDPSLQLIPGGDPTVCASASWTCLGTSDHYGNEPENLSWLNGGDATERVFIVIDSDALTGVDFTLTVATEPPPAGDTCETPVAVTPPTTLSSQTLATAGGDYGGDPYNRCTGYGSDGPDLAYAVEIPANSTLSVTVTPLDSAFDPGLYAVPAPASNCGPDQPACPTETCTDGTMPVYLCGSDEGLDGEADTLVIYNQTAAAVPYLVIVDTFQETGGPFDLSFTVDGL